MPSCFPESAVKREGWVWKHAAFKVGGILTPWLRIEVSRQLNVVRNRLYKTPLWVKNQEPKCLLIFFLLAYMSAADIWSAQVKVKLFLFFFCFLISSRILGKTFAFPLVVSYLVYIDEKVNSVNFVCEWLWIYKIKVLSVVNNFGLIECWQWFYKLEGRNREIQKNCRQGDDKAWNFYAPGV